MAEAAVLAEAAPERREELREWLTEPDPFVTGRARTSRAMEIAFIADGEVKEVPRD